MVYSRLLLSFKNQAASCCFCFCCGYVGNAFALSKRSGISIAFAAASILSMPPELELSKGLAVTMPLWPLRAVFR